MSVEPYREVKFGMAKAVPITLVAFALLLIGLYASLIPYGHWQPDEYQNLVSYRADPTNFFWRRLLTWSPRPLSEALIYVYLSCVEAFHRPLVAWGLAPGWIMLFVATLLPLGRATERPSLDSRLVQRLTLFCLFLLGHGIAELFYWPLAALAYLPTLAAIVFLYVLSDSSLPEGKTICWAVALALVVAAASSEVGAMYVVCHGVAALAHAAWRRNRRSPMSIGFVIVPLAIAVGVLYRLSVGRISLNGETFGEARYIHHVLPSIGAAVPHALWDIVSADSLSIDARHLITGAVIKIAFFIGCCVVAASRPLPGKSCRRIPIVAACFAMVPVTLAAAYFQFGMMACCERHAAFRQCMVLIGLASAASWIALWEPFRRVFTDFRRSMILACLCFGIALLAGLTLSYSSLRNDYLARGSFLSVRQATWASAADRAGTMTVYQVEPGRIVGGYPLLSAGYYTLADHPAPEATAILQFFERDHARFSTSTGNSGDGLRSTK